MVTLPSAISLGARDIPQSNRNIVGFDGGAVGRATQRAGQEMQQFGAQAQAKVDEQKNNNDKLEAANALLLYNQSMYEATKAAEADPEGYENYGKLFEGASNDASTKALATVTNPEMRASIAPNIGQAKLRYAESFDNLTRTRRAEANDAYSLKAIDNYKGMITADTPIEEVQTQALLLKQRAIELGKNGTYKLDEGYKKGIAYETDLLEFFLQKRLDANADTFIDFLDGISSQGAKNGAVGFDAAMAQIEPSEVSRSAPDKINEDGKNKDGQMTFAYRGINSGANPEEFKQIQSLLASGKTGEARAIANKVYKEKYWDAIDADSIPANAQAIIMDAAVNQGVGYAKTLKEKLAQGATPAELIQMRRERYAKTDGTPEEKTSWENRLKELGSASGIRADTMQKFRDKARPLLAIQYANTMDNNIAAAKLGLPINPLDESKLAMAFPNDPNKAADYKTQLQLANDTASLKTMGVKEINDLVNSKKPTTNSSNLAEQNKAYELLKTAIEADRVEKTTKTVETAMQFNPTVKSLFDEGKIEAAFDEVIAQVNKWGVAPVEFYKNAPQSQVIVSKMTTEVANAKREDRLGIITGYASLMGKHWSLFVVEAVDAKLNSGLRVAADLSGVNARAAEGIANLIGESDESLLGKITKSQWSGSGEPSMKGVESLVGDAMQPMIKVLNYSNSKASGDMINAITRETSRLALSYAGQNLSITDAISKAVEDVAGNDAYADTFRVPKAYISEYMPLQRYKYGAEQILSKITKDDIDLQPVRDYNASKKLYLSNEDTLRAIKATGIWINSTDNKAGLTLALDTPSGVPTIIFDKKGKPFTKEWKDFGQVPIPAGVYKGNDLSNANRGSIPMPMGEY